MSAYQKSSARSKRTTTNRIVKSQRARKSNAYTGRGKYNQTKLTPFFRAVKPAVSMAGGALGGYIGGPGGAIIGENLAREGFKAFRHISGLGAYNVDSIRTNALLQKGRYQVMNPMNPNGDTFRHSEFLGNVYSSNTPLAFKIDTYNINPGLESTFPWLASIAANYEQYIIEGMIFEFRSTSADALNSTNSALGSVLLCTQYNVLDPLFNTSFEMENYENAQTVRTSENGMHGVECDPSLNQSEIYYVRTSTAQQPDQDNRLYDLGRFSIASEGVQGANVNLGKLYVHYQVRLIKKRIYTQLGLYDSFWKGNASTSITGGNPLGSPSSWTATNPANTLDVSILSSSTFKLPKLAFEQTYAVELKWFKASAPSAPFTASGVSVPASAGTVIGGLFQAPEPGASALSYTLNFIVRTKPGSQSEIDDGCIVTLDVPTITANDCTLWIIQIPNNYA